VETANLEILRRLQQSVMNEHELTDIYYQNKDNYRILFFLVQQSKFPAKLSLNLIPTLFAMDLIRVIKNKRTNPFIRKKAETEFIARYEKFPKGEKLSYLKIAPLDLLNHFVEEKDPSILEVILKNYNCTEDLILRLINRKSNRFEFYKALSNTEWYKRPAVAYAVTRDTEAPIKLILQIIPFLNKNQLQELYEKKTSHKIVKENVLKYFKSRKI
jgi:hypothetical protein